jgi:uncharacterized protein YndB with AHSA1/START domain
MTEQTPVQTGEQEVLITRVFDAPRDLVFKLWTDPDHVAKWWEPEGFHTPRDSVHIDLQPGGRYDLDMVEQASGTAFPVRHEVAEVVEPELLVLKSAPQPELGLPFTNITRVELEDDGGKTRMTLTSGPYTETMQPYADAGWNGSMEKLDGLLASA